ncbi:Multidrug resistance protein MdtA [Sinobacterium norvegicum]|uniref:Multidrug resistance protein MdtA n=1 Tax=Sinobacterium norvegicum TaxID=1641715 RepID=A0ABM9AHI1_9GAMM|nr:efflux RND transporter periplasmic adaptor subunit [Sinobacterium norvegicum]CAH0992467.1 Multidrug resistance protein MdtA [Sinobacterium norvegicum]
MKLHQIKDRPWLVVAVVAALLVAYRFAQVANQASLPVVEREPVRVNTLFVQPQNLITFVFSEGTVQASRKAFLDFEMAGKVVDLGSDSDGEELREGVRVFGPKDGATHGQMLARIDSRENTAGVQSLEAQLQSARAQKSEAEAKMQQVRNDLAHSQQNYLRMKEVYERGVIAQDEFNLIETNYLNAQTAIAMAKSSLQATESEIQSVTAELNKAAVSLEKTALFAPFDGVVTAMNLRRDNHYYPPVSGTSNREREANSAFVIVDDSQMEIQLELPASQAKSVKEGQVVYLAADDRALYAAEKTGHLNQAVAQGTIWSVSPAINLQRRSQTVKVRFQQGNLRLNEGQFVRAWIVVEQVENVATLPRHAMSFKHGKPYVYVVDSNNKVSVRQLELGLSGLRQVEIISGVSVGDAVVERGQHLLVDGGEVIIVGDTQ